MLEAFISLPLLSLFALPWLTNFSTSLNLLFFYMTWSILVLSYSPLQVELIGTSMARAVFFLAPNLLFLVIDTLLPTVAVNLKAQGENSLPGRLGASKVAKVAGLSIFNVLLGIALQGGIELALKALQIRSALRITTTLPMPWNIFIDVMWAFALRGVSFLSSRLISRSADHHMQLLSYYIHRFILHAPSKSKYSLPHLHRTYCHSIQYPFAFCSSYDHPLCYLLHRWVPLYLPAYLFRMHILVFEILIVLTSLEEVFAYSGYGSAFLPGTIIVNRMARRVESHQMTRGKGNFGGIGVLDWAHNSGIAGIEDVGDDLADEAEKHDLAGKANRAIDDAGSTMQNLGGKLKGKSKKGASKKSA